MSGKISLKPNPTWRGKVGIPTPNGVLELEFEFKHRKRSTVEAFFQEVAAPEKTNVDAVMECASNWFGPEEPFTRENVAILLDDFHASDRVIIKAYFDQLTEGRLGN